MKSGPFLKKKKVALSGLVVCLAARWAQVYREREAAATRDAHARAAGRGIHPRCVRAGSRALSCVQVRRDILGARRGADGANA
jgi:hypothetical protein